MEGWLATRMIEAFDATHERAQLVIPYQFAAAYLERPEAPKVDAVIANFYWGIEFARTMADEDWGEKPDAFLLAEMEARAMPALEAKLRERRDLIDRLSQAHYPLAAWTYEGGSHFHDIWWNRAMRDKTGNATGRLRHHPAMFGLTARMFEILRQTGFDDTNYLFANTGGGFGHLQYPSQDPQQAPKYRAALEEARR
jgi:hypothetical protein